MELGDLLKDNYLYYTNNGEPSTSINLHETFENCPLEDVIPFKFKSSLKILIYRDGWYSVSIEGRYTGEGFDIDTFISYPDETFSEFLTRTDCL